MAANIINVSESVSIAESLTRRQLYFVPSLSDAISVQDVSTELLPKLKPNVLQESTVVGEFAGLKVGIKTPVAQSDGSLIYTTIDGPTHIFVNQSLNAILLDKATIPQEGKFVIVAGFEPCLYIYGSATTFTLVIYTSPDGFNFVPVATCTEATAVKTFGRNELHFPIHSLACYLTAVAGGNLSAQCYAERRK